MESLLSTTGSISVVGALLVGIVALYLGLVSPRYIVSELKTRTQMLEAEHVEQNRVIVRLTEEKGGQEALAIKLAEQVKYLSQQIEQLQTELARLRRLLTEKGVQT